MDGAPANALNIPRPPVFATVAEERLHRKRMSAAAFRLFRGEVVEGNYPVNGAAFAIHSQVHAARPDVIAAAHAHSMYGKSWASLGRLLDPIT